MKIKRSVALSIAYILIAIPVFIALLSIKGCALFDAPTPEPLRDSMVVKISIVDGFDNPRQLAKADVIGDWAYCNVEVRRDIYPNCITHEIMHCFSDAWHGTQDSDQFCELR